MNKNSLNSGALYALAAYCMWGFAPLYFRLLDNLAAIEILMHRIVWSVVLLLAILLLSRKFEQVKKVALDLNVLKRLLITSFLLAGNWLIFIWAVNNGYLLEVSLGYYINPLFNILLARFFLQERLSGLQKLSVFIVLVSVMLLIFSHGQLPWIALLLAASFSLYGLLRKKAAVDSAPGLLIESMMMLPFAGLYWFISDPVSGNLMANSLDLNVTLFLSAVVTSAPLLCFTAAAKRIRYSTLGLFQYLGPTIMFLLATLYLDEPLEAARILTFTLVWLALAIYSFDSVITYRRKGQ